MVFQCKKNTCKTDAGTFFRLYRRKNPRPETRTGIITCCDTTGRITLPTLIYSCFWRVLRSKLLLQASLHRSSELCPLVSSEIILYAKKVGNKKRPRGIKFPGSYAPCLFCCTFPPASAGRSPIFYTYPSSPGSQSDSAGM